MISTAIALLVAIQAPQQDASQDPNPSASQILTKVFKRYAGAQSISGTIKGAQSVKDPKTGQIVTVLTQSDLQYERPSKIYLHQARNGSQGREWLLVSDGKTFSYDKPGEDQIHGQHRFTEYVSQHDNTQTIADLYLAAELSLGDLNPILDVAISAPTRLRKLKGQWATLQYKGRQTLEDGQSVQVVGGRWRESESVGVAGEFEAYVNNDGDFVRYILVQRFAFPKVSPDPVFVRTQWDSNLKLDGKTEPGLYKVIR